MSSTVGSPTYTGWNRRSRAASFSMYLRYSSSVVAPMHRSSPRASAGLSRLAASLPPSAAPAPTTVCSSSMNRMIAPLRVLHFAEHGLEPLFELAAELRAGDQGAHVQGDDPLVLQALRHVALDDPQRQPFGDRRLADARLADQHGVVLGAPRKHLDDAADLLVAADHRIELALARPARPGRCRTSARAWNFSSGRLVGHAGAAADLLQGLEQFLLADGIELERILGLRFRASKSQQQMLGRDELVLHLSAASWAASSTRLRSPLSCGGAPPLAFGRCASSASTICRAGCD